MESGYLWIGAITKPHGLRGHLIVQAEPDSGDSLKPGGRVVVGRDQNHEEFEISEAQARGRHFIVRFKGVEDREGAEALVGRALYVSEESLGQLPAGEYYWHQMIGLRVVSEEGRLLGCLEEVFSTPAHDVWVARAPGKEYLIPAVDEVILSVDPREGEVKVRTLPGLWEVDGH
jgi:16S rRNA processing protein RimM